MTNRVVLFVCAIATAMCSELQAVNLQAALTTPTSITLRWTAPGDDNHTGKASVYDIRYSLATITAANWVSATKATGIPAPKAAGSAESFEVTGLAVNTRYYFAMKTGDEVPNWSAMSNVIQRSTQQDATPPAAIANLAAGAVTTSTVVLGWTAPGDDGNVGTAATYDIRYSTAAITAANFASASQVVGEPTPKTAGSTETFTVLGLSFSAKYYFAIETGDETPNWSGLSNTPSVTTCGGICTGARGNVDCSPDGKVDIADLTMLIEYLYLSTQPMCICLAEANIDADLSNRVDISDLTRLIDYLYISLVPLSPCS